MPISRRQPLAAKLPEFPWDTLADIKALAAQHPDGVIDLSVGSPVDDVAPSIQQALSTRAAESAYPAAEGTPQLRRAIVQAMQRRFGVAGLSDGNGDAPTNVMPVIGTKEAIASLPLLLGVGSGNTVVIPELAYPTYDIAARISGASVVRADSLMQLGPASPAMMFINTPSNPNGKVLGVEHLRKVAEWARARNVLVASDECYLGLGWDAEPVSILDPQVCDGDFSNLLAFHSLSKSSNMASYRAGWIAGDADLIAELLSIRRHLGLKVPGPVQEAMVTALADEQQVARQKTRYARRRDILKSALVAAGFQIDDSEAGLYLWATQGKPCHDTLQWLAQRGIVAAPGDLYGPKGAMHVRIGLTAETEAIEVAAGRLRAQ